MTKLLVSLKLILVPGKFYTIEVRIMDGYKGEFLVRFLYKSHRILLPRFP